MSTGKNERTALYRHRDCNGTLLYVGISLSVAARLAQHAGTSHWFAEVTQVDVEYFPTRAEAEAAERQAIRTEHPRCNKAHVVAPQQPTPVRQRVTRRQPLYRSAGDDAWERDASEDVWPGGNDAALRYVALCMDVGGQESAPHADAFARIAARYPAGADFLDMGHRFWLALSDDEYDAALAVCMHSDTMFWYDTAMSGLISWSDAALEIHGAALRHENGWGYKRREISARWPNGRFPRQLAAA
jgi:predicted GIY-YIG superfamily endonuclease